MTSLVEVESLRKTYRSGWRRRRVEAVRGISFHVEPGEILGIIGPNGAGKTTTLKMLTGLVRPDSGSATLFGNSVRDVHSRARLGYLPENPYFYEHLKVPELLMLYGRLFGIDRRTLHQRIERLVERVGLSHATDRPLRKFSKGMRQRAGIAQALINDPELVILDEPQSGLDPIGRKEVRDLIVELRAEGKTVMFSSHILPDVESVCDRVIVIHQGQIVDSGSVAELTGGRVDFIEVVAAGLAREALRGIDGILYQESRGEGQLLRFAGDTGVNELVARLMSAGAEIRSVHAERMSLETIFVRDTTAPSPPPGNHSPGNPGATGDGTSL